MGEFDQNPEEIVSKERSDKFYSEPLTDLKIDRTVRTNKMTIGLKKPVAKIIRNVIFQMTETMHVIAPTLVFISVHIKTVQIPYGEMWSVDVLHRFEEKQDKVFYSLETRLNIHDQGMSKDVRSDLETAYQTDLESHLSKLFDTMLTWVTSQEQQ